MNSFLPISFSTVLTLMCFNILLYIKSKKILNIIAIFINFFFIIIIIFYWIKDFFVNIQKLSHLYNEEYALITIIISKIILFLTFIWTYYHLSLEPENKNYYIKFEIIGGVWPPFNFKVPNKIGTSLYETIIIYFINILIKEMKNEKWVKLNLTLCLILLILFILTQLYEFYFNWSLYCNLSIYNSILNSLLLLYFIYIIISIIIIILYLTKINRNNKENELLSFIFNLYLKFITIIWNIIYICIYI